MMVRTTSPVDVAAQIRRRGLRRVPASLCRGLRPSSSGGGHARGRGGRSTMPAVIRMLPVMRRHAPRLCAGYSLTRVRVGQARAKRSRRLMPSSAVPIEDMV